MILLRHTLSSLRYYTCRKRSQEQGWQYGTVRYVRNLRTTYLAPRTVPYQRTVLQFNFWSVPYQRTVPVPFQKRRTIPAYRTSEQKLKRNVPYRTAILAFNYSQLKLTLKLLVYKSKISILTFSVGFSCLLPLHTKIRCYVQKVWGFLIQTAYQRTVPVPLQTSVPYLCFVPVPLQKKRTVPTYRTS